jgi:hypothetical protein
MRETDGRRGPEQDPEGPRHPGYRRFRRIRADETEELVDSGSVDSDGAPDRPATRPVGRPPREAAEDDDPFEGRLVRLYTLTGGRTRPAADLDLIAQVVATDRTPAPYDALTPEHEGILELLRERPLAVAEVAAGADLPVGITRVLLGDLIESDLVRASRPVPPALLPDERILREVINGLRAL